MSLNARQKKLVRTLALEGEGIIMSTKGLLTSLGLCAVPSSGGFRQTPGAAYLHIPDNKTPTNINVREDSQDRFLYFARYRRHEARK